MLNSHLAGEFVLGVRTAAAAASVVTPILDAWLNSLDAHTATRVSVPDVSVVTPFTQHRWCLVAGRLWNNVTMSLGIGATCLLGASEL